MTINILRVKFVAGFLFLRSVTIYWWVSVRISVLATRSAISSLGSFIINLHWNPIIMDVKIDSCPEPDKPTNIKPKWSHAMVSQVPCARPGWNGQRPRQLLASLPLWHLGGFKQKYWKKMSIFKQLCPGLSSLCLGACRWNRCRRLRLKLYS